MRVGLCLGGSLPPARPLAEDCPGGADRRCRVGPHAVAAGKAPSNVTNLYDGSNAFPSIPSVALAFLTSSIILIGAWRTDLCP